MNLKLSDHKWYESEGAEVKLVFTIQINNHNNNKRMYRKTDRPHNKEKIKS